MSTRSAICTQKSDGTYVGNYCHSDGYYSYNGRLLMEHWHSRQRAAVLTSMGDLPCLGKVIGEKHDFEWRSKAVDQARQEGVDYEVVYARFPQYTEDWCKFYKRDRGDTDTFGGNFQTYDQLLEWFDGGMCQYFYLWQAETWWTLDVSEDLPPSQSKLIPLMEALTADDDTIKPIKIGPAPYLPGRSARLMTELSTYVEPPARLGSGRAIVI